MYFLQKSMEHTDPMSLGKEHVVSSKGGNLPLEWLIFF